MCKFSVVVTLTNKKTTTPRLCFWLFFSHFHFGNRLFSPDEKKEIRHVDTKKPSKPKIGLLLLEAGFFVALDETINKEYIIEEIMAIL